MEQELKKIIASLTGKILIIGIDDSLIKEEINKNKNIISCDVLNLTTKLKPQKNKLEKIGVKKLKPKYKKKKIDYIIINLPEVSNHFKYLLKDFIYLCREKIYVFNYNQQILNSFNRYKVKIKIKNLKKSNLLEIDTSRATNNIIKDIFYICYDTIIETIDIIGDFLMG